MTRTILFSILVATILTACSDENPKFPYEQLNSKKEENAEMILYSCGANPNVDTLIMFCKSKKEDFQNGAFHFLVFFDDKKNASFPNNPLTAGHNDEEQLKHIKAVYTYNHLNGYSKLATYEDNAWESKSNETDIK